MIYRCVNVPHDRADENTFTSRAHLSSSRYTFLSPFSLFPFLPTVRGLRLPWSLDEIFYTLHITPFTFSTFLFAFFFFPISTSTSLLHYRQFARVLVPGTTFRALLRFAARSFAHRTNESVSLTLPTRLCFLHVVFVVRSKKNHTWYQKILEIPGVELKHVRATGGDGGETVCPANKRRQRASVPYEIFQSGR